MSNTESEKIVYFIRHGQSEGNISPVYQSVDSPLSEEGKNQANLIAERIGKLSFDVLISSPLPRTKETSEAITKVTGKVPEYSDLFVERIKPTQLDGKSHDDVEAKNLNKEWNKSLYKSGIRAKDGENFDDIIARTDKALEFLQNREEKIIVVVTHGFFLRTIIAKVLLGNSLNGDNFWNFQSRVTMENTGLSVLKYGKYSKNYGDISWRLWIYNDHSHLG